MKLFKNLGEIYKFGLNKTHLPGYPFECSVCRKKYKREGAAQKHVDKQDCFKYQDMFQGTLVEPILFDLFQQSMVTDSHGKFIATLTKFRKSSSYTIYAKFWLFCFRNNMSTIQINHFFCYLIDESFRKYNSYEGKKLFSSAIISKGTNETSLVEYRKACINGNCTHDISNEFYEKYEETLGKDVTFTIRSLERGDITYKVLFDNIDFDEFVEKLSMAEQKTLESFLETVL